MTVNRITRANILFQYPVILSAVIAFIVLAVFSGALSAGFVNWDDDVNLAKLHGLGAGNIYPIFTDLQSMNRYVPLFFLTQNIIYHFYHLNPFVYHFTAWLIHGLCSGLVFLVIRKTVLLSLNIQRDDLVAYRQANIAAGLSALFWALHPLRVETAAWSAGLTHTQALFFLLLAALCYMEAVDFQSGKKRYVYLMAAAFIFYTASLLTHAIAITFFAVLFIMDFFLFKRIGGDAGWWKSRTATTVWLEKLIFAVPAFFAVLMAVVVRIKSAGVSQPAISLSDFGILDRVMQAMYILAYYLWRPFYPADLSPIYTMLVSFNPLSMPFVLSAVAVAALSVALFIFRKRWPLIAALWLAYILVLIPVMGFSEHPYSPFDRYSLLPSICLSILIAFGLMRLMEKKYAGAISAGALLIVIVVLSCLSMNQIKIWHNSETLFTHIIKTMGNDPNRQGVHMLLGEYLYKNGRRDEAVMNFEKALALNRYNLVANSYMARIEYENNNPEKSIVHLQNILIREPDNAGAHDRLSKIFEQLNRKKEAAYHRKLADDLQRANQSRMQNAR
jgi:tetratricopeptide (TPR) repeat protein